ncbi:MAG: competence protein ComEA [Desulfuromonas sp.]|nr:MAG: competence protein ComEA [Desulfuromonas sp.]
MFVASARILSVVLLSVLLFCQPVLAQEKLNINTATVEQFSELNGIGEKTALKIIEYRKQHGAFSDVAELINIKGIGEKKLDRIKDQIVVEDEKKTQ